MRDPSGLKIGIVGPCAAGKTTLAEGLRRQGLSVRQIAQEHSYVPRMWKLLADPDLLIFLDVSHPVSLQRRPQNFTPKDFAVQVERLDHARKNADIYVDTDPLTIDQVLERVLELIDSSKSG